MEDLLVLDEPGSGDHEPCPDVRLRRDQRPVALALRRDLVALAEAVGAVPKHPPPPRVNLDPVWNIAILLCDSIVTKMDQNIREYINWEIGNNNKWRMGIGYFIFKYSSRRIYQHKADDILKYWYVLIVSRFPLFLF